MSNYLQMR